MSRPGKYREGHHISERGVRIMHEALSEAVRRLDGTEAFELPDGVAKASVEDGRPYELFLAHIIELGLAEWHRQKRNSQPLT